MGPSAGGGEGLEGVAGERECSLAVPSDARTVGRGDGSRTGDGRGRGSGSAGVGVGPSASVSASAGASAAQWQQVAESACSQLQQVAGQLLQLKQQMRRMLPQSPVELQVRGGQVGGRHSEQAGGKAAQIIGRWEAGTVNRQVGA